MLLLTFDLKMAPGPRPLPEHLGGVLHGFVEGAVKNHAPQLLPLLRPNGKDRSAHFMVLPPPVGQPVDNQLRFGVMLFGAAAQAWHPFTLALLSQQAQQINRRPVRIMQAWMMQPGGASQMIVESGEWLDSHTGRASSEAWQQQAMAVLSLGAAPRIFSLTFRSPLLLASRKAQRDRLSIAGALPWPSQGAILDSIAQRLHELEPRLAKWLGIPEEWKASDASHANAPLTPAHDAAQQAMWPYSSTPRSDGDAPSPSARRELLIPGIIGTLAYPASGEAHEHALLYWGQWLGVGQKTTMGWGSYALSTR